MPSIEELEQRIVDLSTQLAEVRAAQAQANSNVPSASTNPAAVPSLMSMGSPGPAAPKPKGPRVDTPETFDGDRSKAYWNFVVDRWVRWIRYQLNANREDGCVGLGGVAEPLE